MPSIQRLLSSSSYYFVFIPLLVIHILSPPPPSSSKPLSKVFEKLESLWKQGWGGFADFPDNFPHLYGAHINTHKWREDGGGPPPLGLPVEGILERKDHPYYKYVKERVKTSPISTHLVGDKDKVNEDDVTVHQFVHDRHYNARNELLFNSIDGGTASSSTEPDLNDRSGSDPTTSTTTTTSSSINMDSSTPMVGMIGGGDDSAYVPAEILAKYFASDSNSQVLHPLLDPAQFLTHPGSPQSDSPLTDFHQSHLYHHDNLQRLDLIPTALPPMSHHLDQHHHPHHLDYHHVPHHHAEMHPHSSPLDFIAMNPLPVFTPILEEDRSFGESIDYLGSSNVFNNSTFNGSSFSHENMTTTRIPLKAGQKDVTMESSSSTPQPKSWITRHITSRGLNLSKDKFSTREDDNKTTFIDTSPPYTLSP